MRDEHERHRRSGAAGTAWSCAAIPGVMLAGLLVAGCAGGDPQQPPAAPVRLIDLEYGRGPAEAAPGAKAAEPEQKKKGQKPAKRLRAPRPIEEQTSLPPGETGSETDSEQAARLRTAVQRLDGNAAALDRRIEGHERRDRPSASEIELYGASRARHEATIARQLDLERRGIEADRQRAEQDADRLIFEQRLRGPNPERR